MPKLELRRPIFQLFAVASLLPAAVSCAGEFSGRVTAVAPDLESALRTASEGLVLPSAMAIGQPVTVWDHLQQADEQLYVVVLRHAIAPGTGDPASFQLDDCATQRNLSEAGRLQAQQIGAAFRERQVAVTQVLSSQWCRCLDTATLLDIGPVQAYAPLNSFFRDRTTATAQTTELQQYLRSQPSPGVIVLVTHQVNITALTGAVPRSGQAVVLTLDHSGDLNQVGVLDPGA
ncbi:MAG: hypothetical protein WBG38_01860 [Nodosilinea sp.]